MASHLEERGVYFGKVSYASDSKQYAKCTVLSTRACHKKHYTVHLHNLATFDEWNGDYQKAIKKYRLAAIVDPNSKMIFNAWGPCLSHLGRYDEAISKVKKALEIDSNYEHAYLNWGLILFWQQKKDEAEEIIKEGLEKVDFSDMLDMLDMLIDSYEMELSLFEGRLEKASNEEEKEFLKERIVGYHWMLELIRKRYEDQTLLEDEENQ